MRLRPIVMTSFTFILGVLPLVTTQGAEAEMRRTLGTAVFAGMIGVTFFGIFLTPVFYSVVRFLNGHDRSGPKAIAQEPATDRPLSPEVTIRDMSGEAATPVASV